LVRDAGKVFRGFRNIKAVFRTRFGAHLRPAYPLRIKGLRIFALSTRAHPEPSRVKGLKSCLPAEASPLEMTGAIMVA